MGSSNKVLLFFTLFLLVSTSVQAATTNRFSTFYFDYGFGPNDQAVTLSTNTLDHRQFHMFTGFEYIFRPIEFTQGGTRVRGVNDHVVVQYVGMSYGLLDFWQVDFQLPIVWLNRFNAPITPEPGAANRFDLGDVRLRSRFTVLDAEKKWLGLSIVPFLTIPTGNDQQFTGDTRPTAGITIAAEKIISKAVTFGLNTGVRYRQNVNYQDYITKGLLHASGGFQFHFSDYVSASTEVVSQTTLHRPFKDKVTTPLETLAQVKYHIPNSDFRVFAGGGLGILRAPGVGKFRAFSGISWTPSLKVQPVSPIFQTIYFDTDRFDLSNEEVEKLNELKKQIEKQPKERVIKVSGHTDADGSDEYNSRLSENRSEAVRSFLVEQLKVRATQIESHHFGESKPVDNNSTSAGKRKNRRVEIRVE